MSDPTDHASETPSAEHTVAVDLAAFLPDGVELAPADTGELAAAPTPPPAPWRPDLEALDALEADLDAVDTALAALDEGTYGICRTCAQPITDDLLALAPTRTTCAATPDPNW